MQRTCELSFPIYSTVILRLARVLVSVHVLASVLFELSRRDIHILTQTHVAYTVYLVVLRDGVAPCVETGGWRGGGARAPTFCHGAPTFAKPPLLCTIFGHLIHPCIAGGAAEAVYACCEFV